MFTSPETSRKLKNAGIKIRTLYYWQQVGDKYMLLTQPKTYLTPGISVKFISAYTIYELGEMIPWGFFQQAIVHKMPGGIWQVKLSDENPHTFKTEVEARAAYLLDLLATKQIDVDEINHPEKYTVFMPGGKTYPVKKKIAKK